MEYQIDGSVIQPYKKVISHGGTCSIVMFTNVCLFKTFVICISLLLVCLGAG